MAKFSKSELAYALGVGRSSVSNWITRGHIFEDEHGLIDDTNIRNSKYIEGKLKKIGGSYRPPQEIQETRAAVNKTRKEPKVPKVKKPTSKSTDDLDDQKKKAEIKYKLTQIEMNELKAAKLKGDNVPTKLVENVFIMVGNSFQSEYRDSSENLLSQLAHECKIGSKMHAKYKDLFIKMINEAHSTAIAIVESELKQIVSETSGKIILENE